MSEHDFIKQVQGLSQYFENVQIGINYKPAILQLHA